MAVITLGKCRFSFDEAAPIKAGNFPVLKTEVSVVYLGEIGFVTAPGELFPESFVGFDPAQVGEDSFGLRGLAGRMAQVGGTLDVDSVLGEGTTVALAVPLTAGHRASARPAEEHP